MGQRVSPACARLCSQFASFILTPLAPHKKSAHPGLFWSAEYLPFCSCWSQGGCKLTGVPVVGHVQACRVWAACIACTGQLARGTFVLCAALLERTCTPPLSFWRQEPRGRLAVGILCGPWCGPPGAACSNVVLCFGTLSAAAVWSYSAFGLWGFSGVRQCESKIADWSHLEGSLLGFRSVWRVLCFFAR